MAVDGRVIAPLLVVLGRLLQRHHWIAYVGLAIILYVACEMIFRGIQELLPVFGRTQPG